MKSLGWLLFLAIVMGATFASFAVAADPAKDDVVHGLAPMPNDVSVPPKLLPPGAPTPDNGPSDVIFPQQTLTIRFNHKFHLKEAGATCKTCHAQAATSSSSQDVLIPKGTTCDACHDSDHSNLAAVKPGSDAMGNAASVTTVTKKATATWSRRS
ncbi:MAG: cytochrome c3 family protein [Polyangiaceae bacterium]